MERFSLTPERKALLDEATRKKLAAMTEQQREEYFEAVEADAWREALLDDFWGKA